MRTFEKNSTLSSADIAADKAVVARAADPNAGVVASIAAGAAVASAAVMAFNA